MRVLTATLAVAIGMIGGYLYRHSDTLTTVFAKADALRAAFPDCGNPCVITNSPGGDMFLFRDAADSLQDGDLVSITGSCVSSCVLFADYGRPRVCVSKTARMGFHQGVAQYKSHKPMYMDPPHSRDILLWVRERGDFPNTEQGKPLLVMWYPDTNRFWPLCPGTLPITKSDRQV